MVHTRKSDYSSSTHISFAVVGIPLGNRLLIGFDTVAAIILGLALPPSPKLFVPRSPAKAYLISIATLNQV